MFASMINSSKMSTLIHWRSSHYAVTHTCNENSVHIQERSPNLVSDFLYHKELLSYGSAVAQWKSA